MDRETHVRLTSLIGLCAGFALLAGCASSPDGYRSFDASAGGSSPYQDNYSGRGSSSGAPVDAGRFLAASSDHQKVGRPYRISGRTYRPVREDNYDRTGIASWYGPNFHGRSTANGETFDQHAMTAAHTTLPIPSIVEVTNLDNGRSILVRVNDRGPFVDDRIIDLSRAAATELDYIGAGLAPVRVRYLGPARPNGAPPPRTHYTGSVPSHARPQSQPAPEPVPEPIPQPVLQTVAAATAAPVQIAMADPLPAPQVAQPALPQTPAYTPPAGSGLTLQIGAFSDASNAQRFADRVASAGEVWVQAGEGASGPVYRVYFGQWSDRGAAHAAREQLADWGIYDSRIVALN